MIKLFRQVVDDVAHHHCAVLRLPDAGLKSEDVIRLAAAIEQGAKPQEHTRKSFATRHQKAKNLDLKVIDLNNNNIGNKGAIALARAIAHHPTLQTLKLYNTNIGKSGAAALAKAVGRNPLIVEIAFGGNPGFDDAGMQNLFDTIAHGDSKNILYAGSLISRSEPSPLCEQNFAHARRLMKELKNHRELTRDAFQELKERMPGLLYFAENHLYPKDKRLVNLLKELQAAKSYEDWGITVTMDPGTLATIGGNMAARVAEQRLKANERGGR